MIPVLIKRYGEELPELPPNSMRYVVASNGNFVERRTPLYTTSTRVDSCAAGLAEHQTRCHLHAPSIPHELVEQMVAFFRYGYTLHGGEAALVLLYSPLEQTYQWYCPEQSVEMWESWSGKWYSSPDIQYVDPLELPVGFVVYGDAHSHANMPAYASAIDQQDEEHKDGLHIVVGNLHKRVVDLYADFVMDGGRFQVTPEDVLELPELDPDGGFPNGVFPDEWRDQIKITKKPYDPPTWFGSGSNWSGSGGGSSTGSGSYGGTTWGGAPGATGNGGATGNDGYGR